MDMPVVIAERLVKSAGLTWLDEIYRGAIPKEKVTDTTSTTAAITEYVSEPAGDANATFKRWSIGVEVQVYYKANVDFSIQDAEIALAKLFKAGGWSVDQSKPHTTDPGTNQVSKVFYFDKIINLKEAK